MSDLAGKALERVTDGLCFDPKVELPTGWMYFVYPSSGQVPRKVTAFRDFVVNALRSRQL